MPERLRRPRRADYRHFLAIPTRWMDNDLYGHVNNVVYYSWIDTVVNRYLIDEGGLDISAGEVIGVAAEGGCRYYRVGRLSRDGGRGPAHHPAGQLQRGLRRRHLSPGR